MAIYIIIFSISFGEMVRLVLFSAALQVSHGDWRQCIRVGPIRILTATNCIIYDDRLNPLVFLLADLASIMAGERSCCADERGDPAAIQR